MTDETDQKPPSSKLTIRLTPRLSDVCRTLSDTLQISRSQVMKQALDHYHHLLTTPNVGQTSDVLARAHGIYTSYNTIRAISPLPLMVKPIEDEEEENQTLSTNTKTKDTPDEISHHPNNDEKFEEWWKFYPKYQGMRPDKEKCRRAWHDLDADQGFESIMECTQRLKDSKSWMDGYAPMPLNYLTKKLWRNAPEPEPTFIIHGQ